MYSCIISNDSIESVQQVGVGIMVVVLIDVGGDDCLVGAMLGDGDGDKECTGIPT